MVTYMTRFFGKQVQTWSIIAALDLHTCSTACQVTSLLSPFSISLFLEDFGAVRLWISYIGFFLKLDGHIFYCYHNILNTCSILT